MDRPPGRNPSGDFETFLYDKLLFFGLYLWFVLSSKCDNNPSIISPCSTKNQVMIRALRTPVRVDRTDYLDLNSIEASLVKVIPRNECSSNQNPLSTVIIL